MGETLNLSNALAIFSDHLPDIRKACVLNAKALQEIPHKKWNIDTEQGTIENIRLHLAYLNVTKQISKLERVIKRIDGRRKHYQPGQITDANIEQAREYPIKELYEQLTGYKPRHGMVHCPFHDDRTASMSVGKYNRYKCFGCDEKGDVIDLYMKLEGVDFITAIKKLI